MKILFVTILILTGLFVNGQTPCTAPGQNPSTAFPVCGTSTFTQTSVPLCGGQTVPVPSCNSNVFTDINPFWYKFTCFQGGTLGFKIKPHTNSEDYDWQLFDITGRNSIEVYSNINLVVACNWSGEGGETGASAAGNNLFVCEGFGKPLWSKMPTLIQGHEYILLVSHFTQTQSGYDLSFGGGTAVITDPTLPALRSAEASCGGDVIRVKLNKKMKCSSVAANGSDFFITPGNISVTSATAINCSNGFDTDSLELRLGAFLSPGTYTVNIKQGSDGNTVLDYCNDPIPATDKVTFTVHPLVPTPMDSTAPSTCKADFIKLVFRKPMICSSVAPNGSDFIISGSYPVSITSATGGCPAGGTTSKEIIIRLSQPLYTAGNFTLTLLTGTDRNTILDECGKETPAGSAISFSVKDTVNADFTYQKFYGCVYDTVNLFHPGGNGVNSWNWQLDDNQTSTAQNPQVLYSVFNNKKIMLAVGNAFCTDTSVQTVALTNHLKAGFTSFDDLCPNEPTQFTSKAEGIIVSHDWSFGDGGTSILQSPSHTYAGPLRTSPFTVQYTVTDSIGCQSTMQKTIKVYSSCYVAVPTGFTPNNDGKNDLLYPLNATKAERLDFKVYNRWGQLIFQTNNWKRGWDGTYKGYQQSTGVYVWFLSYADRDSKEIRTMKGTTVLIR